MKKVLLSALISIASLVSYAQVQQTWAYSHIAELHDQYVDANGNIYQTGLAYSVANQSDGYLTIKHDKNGNEIWRHFRPGIEKDSYIAVDASGNVYVAGSTGNPAFSRYISDDTYIYIMKLNASGVFQWSNTYWQAGGSTPYNVYGKPNGLAVDHNGVPYLTGVIFTAFQDEDSGFPPEDPDSATGDFVTIKYDIATGNPLWIRNYNGASPGEGYDDAKGLAIDGVGNVYVSGTSQLNGFMDIATIKYDPSGNIIWTQRFSNTDASLKNDYAAPGGLKLDPAGNVFVAGSSKAGGNVQGVGGDGKRVIIKYTFSGFQLWIRERNILYFSSGPIITDNANNLIESTDGYTLKYNAAGDLQWTYNQDFNGLAVDADNNIYSVRTCLRNDNGLCGNGAYYGFTTRKLSSAGSLLWEKTYTLFANNGAWIGIDADKNIYTSGSEWATSSPRYLDNGYVTVRYSQCGLVCPNNITVNIDAGTCGAVVNFPAATTTGYCGSDITYSHASGSTFSVGTTTVTVTSTETGATCTFDITVVDNQLPVITCPSNKSLNTDPGVCYASAASVNAGQATATDNCSVSVNGVRSDGQSLSDNYPVGTTTITWTATDAGNNTSTCTQTITVTDNVPPDVSITSVSHAVLSPPNHKMIDVSLDYIVTDNCANTVTVTVTSDEPETGLSNGDIGPDIIRIDDKHWQLRAERDGKGDGRVYTILVTATDASGNTSTAAETVVVAHNIGSPHAGAAFRVGSTVNFSGTFWDVPGSKHSAKWVIDGNTPVKASVTEPAGMKNGKVTGSYRFNTPGVYKLRMDITDQNGITTSTSTNGDLEAIIVVYDPKGGYTYGGGYFVSPQGALRSDPLASGDAGYGYTINYYKNASMPKGETQFEFKVGEFEYNALNFEYLAISATKAQFRGTGKIIGGQSGISFIMTVIDGELDGTGIDKARMKIFNKNTGEIYYDNQPGDDDASDPVTPVGDNSIIVIMNNDAPVTGRQSDVTEEVKPLVENLSAAAYPNPFNRQFSLSITSPVSGMATIEFYTLSGARVYIDKKPVTAGAGNIFRYPGLHRYGNLVYKVTIGERQAAGILIKAD